jgi:hypothetical protein
MRDRDNTTRTGAKDPWGREAGPLAQRPVEARPGVDTEPHDRAVAEAGEGLHKLHRGAGTWGAHFTARRGRKVRPDRLALKPYRGKPAVRNFRGGDGNAGIMRSPVRAIALPDLSPYRRRFARSRRTACGAEAPPAACGPLLPPSAPPARRVTERERLRAALAAKLEDWRGLLQRQIPQARHVLKKLLRGSLIFTPNTGERAVLRVPW